MYRKELGDRYYIEIQSNDFGRYMKAMPKIAQLAMEENIPLIATNDNHYEVGEDAAFQRYAVSYFVNQGGRVGRPV